MMQKHLKHLNICEINIANVLSFVSFASLVSLVSEYQVKKQPLFFCYTCVLLRKLIGHSTDHSFLRAEEGRDWHSVTWHQFL